MLEDHGGVLVPDARLDVRTIEPPSQSKTKTRKLTTTVPARMRTKRLRQMSNASCGRMPTVAARAGIPVVETPGGRVNRVFGILEFRNRGEVGSAIWSAKSEDGWKESACKGFQCLDAASLPCVTETSERGGLREMAMGGEQKDYYCRGETPTLSVQRKGLRHVSRRLNAV